MNEYIIFCGDKIVDELCILFNLIFRYVYVFEMFKVGKVILVFKGKNKDKSNFINYRGIILILVFSKLFEKVILFYIENDLLDR